MRVNIKQLHLNFEGEAQDIHALNKKRYSGPFSSDEMLPYQIGRESIADTKKKFTR